MLNKKNFLKSQPIGRINPREFPSNLREKFRPEMEIENNDVFIRYKAYHLQQHKQVTLMILKKTSKAYIQEIKNAIDTLGKINQPNVLPIIENAFIKDNEFFYWATPHAAQVDWDRVNFIEKFEILEFVITLISDIFAVLKIAYKYSLSHEICQESIYIYNDRFCLIDFGLPIVHRSHKNFEDIKSTQTDYINSNILKTDLQNIGILLKEIIFTAPLTALTTSRSTKDNLIGKGSTFYPNIYQFINKLLEEKSEECFQSLESAIGAFEKAVNLELASLEKEPVKLEIAEEVIEELSINQANINIESMPVLSKVMSGTNKLIFNNIVILHINHCLEDVFKFTEAIHSLVHDTVFVAVSYGSQQVPENLPYSVYYPLYKDGEFKIYRNKEQIDEISRDFSSAINALISNALERDIIKFIENGKKILIIEDGGYHYNILHNLIMNRSQISDAIIGAVEQTTSGAIRSAEFIRNMGINYPVLTVSRSDIKMRLESHFIGRRVVDELNYLLYEFNDFLSFHKVLLIGYGIIGRSIARCLNGMNCNISVVDIDKEISSLARRDGYEIYDAVPEYFFDGTPIIIGATGESSFTYSMLNSFLNGNSTRIYLVSASSKRVEFADLIEFFEGSYKVQREVINLFNNFEKINEMQIEVNEIGLAYRFKYEDKVKSIILIAKGFPVNFFRPGSISLTHSMIDPIYAEIFMLSQYLISNSNKLDNNIYFLGHSAFSNLNVTEKELVSMWIEYNQLNSIDKDTNIWENFDIHPLEEKLRLRCINECLRGK